MNRNNPLAIISMMKHIHFQRVDLRGRRNSTITWDAGQQMYVTTDMGLDPYTVREGR